MDSLPLQKLLYYVQAWHLAITDEPLYADTLKGWDNGPVVPEVWHARKDVRSRQPESQDLAGINLDDVASNVIDLVLRQYGSMSGGELIALTHDEDPWKEARGLLGLRNRPIKTETMARFYRKERRLGGRTAADLAASGVSGSESMDHHSPIDVDALLAQLQEEKLEDDPWGGANLEAFSPMELVDVPLVRSRRSQEP
ncbi:hypothetical protein ATM97_27825 [Nocardia sp. MH4]|nr:hypothetical protein [Nocardia sp. MH4]